MAADYDTRLILLWAAEKAADEGWPLVDAALVRYYRRSRKWGPEIQRLRQERHTLAITTGLALKEERIRRLAKHADELEAIKWLPDEKGRLWNEKAWRETLDDIAKEMGDRAPRIDIEVRIRQIAETLGLDPQAAVEEAKRIVSSANASTR